MLLSILYKEGEGIDSVGSGEVGFFWVLDFE